jgi:hypothetical protein
MTGYLSGKEITPVITLKSMNEINNRTDEGKLLLAALSMLTKNKHDAEECLQELIKRANYCYGDKTLQTFVNTIHGKK